jgi:hypothetical protein
MLYSPQDERKLVMLENSLNFRFKKIGTPGAQEIAEASAIVATKKYVLSFDLYKFIIL